MSIAELHPEHLLEKEARGELEPGERERLDAHLALCATCRFERQVRADFAEDLADDGDRISGLIRLAEEAAKRAPEKAEEPEIQKPAVIRPRRRPVGLWFFAAAAMLVVVSAAASEAGRRIWVPIFIHDVAPASPTVTDEVRRTTAPAPSPMLSNFGEPKAVEPVEVTSAPAPVPSAPVMAAPTPSALLDAESDARRRGDYPRVIELHTQLISKHPQSREAQVSRVTVARMLLDRGDPAGALAGFDAYLHDGSGELGEDAMAGRATALERLGRTQEARGAWASLVELYPASAYAAHARKRMEALADR